MSWEEQIAAVKADISTSFWLRRAIDELHRRDPVDAAKDARLLAEIMDARCDALLGTRVDPAGAGGGLPG
ncbi:hypothetical protein [Paraburkholderia sp. J8-2]|uniref:hypothetical protein n=1 Tax=Paraburkholderia sp. J8-2 TaxID=2805440 RepID=UPI002AB6E92C|nr:hypothetical protein [Paraburkholderia sp. J8-2]